MQIELDGATVAELVKQAKAQALKMMVEQIMAQFNANQIAGEVKNSAVITASQRIANEIRVRHNVSDAVNRALRSAEETVRRQIHERLARGITVKFEEPK